MQKTIGQLIVQVNKKQPRPQNSKEWQIMDKNLCIFNNSNENQGLLKFDAVTNLKNAFKEMWILPIVQTAWKSRDKQLVDSQDECWVFAEYFFVNIDRAFSVSYEKIEKW